MKRLAQALVSQAPCLGPHAFRLPNTSAWYSPIPSSTPSVDASVALCRVIVRSPAAYTPGTIVIVLASVRMPGAVGTLHRTDVGARSQQVHRNCVALGIWQGRLVDACGRDCALEGKLEHLVRYGVSPHKTADRGSGVGRFRELPRATARR